jgi:uncharacterized MAPEG superfamily protein
MALSEGINPLPIELKILALSAILLLVHVFAAAQAKTKQYGPAWNMGARDEELPPLNPVAGRLVRAQTNFQETLPIAIIALAGVVLAERANGWTALGGWIWLGARVVYLPLYGFGVPKIRTAVFLLSLVGLGMAIWPLLFG